MYEGFALAVATIIPFDRVVISRFDSNAGISKTIYISGIKVSDREPGDETPIEGTFAQEVMNYGSALLLVGEPNSPEIQKYPGMFSIFQSGIRSCIAAPLVSRDEMTGVMYIQSRDVDAYVPAHVTLASRIASQMSEGIANAELRATIEQEVREKEAIAEIGRIISSSLDIEEVYEAFATNFENLIPLDTINISSIDVDTDQLTVLYGYGTVVAGRQPGARIQIEGSLAGETAAKRQSLIVQDEQESIRQRYPMLAPALDAGLRSFLAVPLIHNDEAIGVLQVRSTTPNAYTEAHLHLAERISHQIAGAIDNARFHNTLENAAREREVLAEIGRVITSSIEIKDVYEVFAHQVKRLLPFDRLSVTTVESDLDRITHPYVSGIKIPDWEPDEYQPYEGSATQKIIEDRTGLLLVGDDRNASGSVSPFPSLSPADSSGLRSMVAVPLYASNQPVGTLTLRSKETNEYTKESLVLAQRIGNQIAGAIANAQLYARLNTAQAALEDSERRYRTLIESGSDVVYTADESGNFSFVAPAVTRLTGYSPEELKGKHFTSLVRKDWVNDTRRFYWLQFKNREMETTFQFPITTASGQTKWVEQRVTRLNPSDGGPNFHGVVRDITDRRAAEEAELERAAAVARADALRRTSQRVVIAQETLRRDIAQQLHGSIQNRLILLMHRLEMARNKVSDEDANKDIQAIQNDLHTILETDIRNISRQLYPSILRQGIVPAIQTLTDQIEPMIPIRLHIDDELVRQECADRRLTPEPVRLAIFRIAEEALTNIVKHAKASTVEVELKLTNDRNSLRVMVRDDGSGFNLASTKESVGLVGMEDYANTMNGKYSIWSEPGRGTVVEATLPISGPGESTEPTGVISE